jgi:prepilin-type processing-associated H-X9-DG protein
MKTGNLKSLHGRDAEVGRRLTAARGSCSSDHHRAFTFIELLVLVFVVAFMAVLAAPALCKTRPNSQSARCLGNLRALISGWQMYAQDNGDRMIISLHGAESVGGAGDPVLGAGWVSGWQDWTLSPDNTNSAFMVNTRYAKMAAYIDQTNTYKCPVDSYVGSLQRTRGWTRRARSYSDNLWVGDGNVESGVTDPIYRHVRRISEFFYPGPAEVWVYVDEHPDSINDAGFFAPHATSWVDVPTTLHGGSAPFAYADGHAEMHRWQSSLMSGRATQVLYSDTLIGIPTPIRDPDIHWVSFATPRNTSTSY